jgi:hypothetical protein
VNHHWERFAAGHSWFVRGHHIEVGELQPAGSWSPAHPAFDGFFPELADLLRRASVTAVVIDDAPHRLFSWHGSQREILAWLSPPPPRQALPALFEEHQVLLTSFGGITETDGPDHEDVWTLNHNALLTEREARRGMRSVVGDTLLVEIEPDTAERLLKFYSIAGEANGNATLCHPDTGEIVMFAHDHDFDHIEVLAGCPELTFYRIRAAPQFRAWVAIVARQWLVEVV